MFTQCPKCQSVFMVSDKDVKAHEGLVRCGNCYSVFNSSWNLTDDPRSDFVGENIDPAGIKSPANQNFTFNLLGQNAAMPASDTVSDQSDQNSEVSNELESEQAVEDTADSIEPDDDLDPFPEPDIGDDFHTITPIPKVKKSDESLLYFDSGSNETEEIAELVVNEDDKPVEIEDLTILQAPSFTSEIPSIGDDDILQTEDENDESTLNSLSEESMWPGAEVSFENDEDDIDSGMPDVGVPEIEVTDTGDGISTLSDFTIDEGLLDDQFEDVPPLDAEPENNSLDSDSQADEPLLPEMPAADDALSDLDFIKENLNDDPFGDGLESGPAELSAAEDDVHKSGKADDTLVVPGESTEADEYFSIDSLPETTSEAFALDDEEESPDIESVFITSEDEDIDEAYVPISLKTGEDDELRQGLDEFPEPGDLSEMNYEDTMQINALLEAANISQQQIETALSEAEIDGEAGDEGRAEKGGDTASDAAMLSQDADIDLTEALYSSEEQSSEESFASATEKKSVFTKLKNLLPLGLGRRKAWKEPAIADTEETQLIQNLSKSESSFTLPLWVSKYSLIAICGLLMAGLFGQLGYFYMDRLVRITPLKPLLEAACSVAGCTVPEIQNINEIEQLSSRMNGMAGNGDGLKVSSVLINRGIRTQAFPALELTLTDRAGNLISRRVITQDKYLSGENVTEMKPNEAANIEIRFRTPSIRVDGFELRAVRQNWLER